MNTHNAHCTVSRARALRAARGWIATARVLKDPAIAREALHAARRMLRVAGILANPPGQGAP